MSQSPALWRFAVPALLALPLTIALLFLMTLLILPDDEDPVIVRMLQDIEFLRRDEPPAPLQLVTLPTPPEPPLSDSARDPQPVAVEKAPNKPAAASAGDEPAPNIDWWAAARSIADEAEEAALQRWLLEQGHEKYVTIMQGPLPITNPADGNLPPTQEDKTGYLNIYGDLEIKLSENCVAQTQVAARFDISDFGQKLPMRITCFSSKKQDLSFERD